MGFLRRPQNLKKSSSYFWQVQHVLCAQQRTCQKVDEDFSTQMWTSRIIQTLFSTFKNCKLAPTFMYEITRVGFHLTNFACKRRIENSTHSFDWIDNPAWNFFFSNFNSDFSRQTLTSLTPDFLINKSAHNHGFSW